MSKRLPVFLSTLPFVLLATMAGLRAQPQDTSAAGRCVIIFVWDGLRADDLTPNITPNYFALARSGVVFTDHRAVKSRQISRFRGFRSANKPIKLKRNARSSS
jgi:predicted AlkP superfamily pyrophosphatase or phosphodiesterase